MVFQRRDGKLVPVALPGDMLKENRQIVDATASSLNDAGIVAFAARLKGQSEPLSTLFYLPPNPNVTYSAALMSKAEETFVTGKAPYPVERTLMTSGILAAAMQSLASDQKRLETPHLAVRYTAPRESLFAQS